jgi:thymidylate synthase
MDINTCVISDENITVLNADSVHNAYLLAINTLDINGTDVFVRNSTMTKNLHNVNIVMHPIMDDPEYPHGYFEKRVFCANRKLKNDYQNAEFAWYMTGSNKVDAITKYMPNWSRFADDGIHVNSNYGHIWRNQILGVINKMLVDKHTRQASIAIYDKSMSNNNVTKDVQCTLSLDFKIVPVNNVDVLHLTVFMRSNDVIYGLPIDMFCFSTLQELVCNELRKKYTKLTLGTYTHIASSLHIYENKFAMLSHAHVNYNNEIIAAKNLHKSIAPNTTFTNFWVAKDPYIFNCIDYEHFIRYLNDHAIMYYTMSAYVRKALAFKSIESTNAFTIVTVMDVINTIAFDAVPDILTNSTEEELFDYICNCLNIAGNTMTLDAFVSVCLLSVDVITFNANYIELSDYLFNNVVSDYSILQSIYAKR